MRSWWGWGTVEDALSDQETQALQSRVAALVSGHDLSDHPPPDLTALGLAAPRVSPPASLAALCSLISSIGPDTRAAKRIATSHATCRASSTTCPTSSPDPAASRT